jgi:hypothetical protein
MVALEKGKPQEKYTVSLKMGGEITSEEMPLSTKAETASRDVYGVQVYVNQNGTYPPYAYGLFDNVDSMEIGLRNDSTYKFVCTLVKNGKDSLYQRT